MNYVSGAEGGFGDLGGGIGQVSLKGHEVYRCRTLLMRALLLTGASQCGRCWYNGSNMGGCKYILELNAMRSESGSTDNG